MPQDRLQTPLQTLPAMLHAVFIQTADVFNSPQRQQPRAVIYTNAQVNTSVPTCNERFQYALDQLEVDILRAKAVLRRDLAERRETERKRLAAEKRVEEAKRATEMARRAGVSQTPGAAGMPLKQARQIPGAGAGAGAGRGGVRGGPRQNFDDFLPAGMDHRAAAAAAGGVGVPMEEASITGGQPLQQVGESDIYNQFTDLFMYQGT